MEKKEYITRQRLIISLTLFLLVLQIFALVFNIISGTGIQLGISVIMILPCLLTLVNLLGKKHPTFNFVCLSIYFFVFILILLFCIPFLIQQVDYKKQCFGDDGDCMTIQNSKYCKIRNRFSVNDSYQECEYSETEIELRIAVSSIDLFSFIIIAVLINQLYKINKFLKFIQRIANGRPFDIETEQFFSIEENFQQSSSELI